MFFGDPQKHHIHSQRRHMGGGGQEAAACSHEGGDEPVDRGRPGQCAEAGDDGRARRGEQARGGDAIGSSNQEQQTLGAGQGGDGRNHAEHHQGHHRHGEKPPAMPVRRQKQEGAGSKPMHPWTTCEGESCLLCDAPTSTGTGMVTRHGATKSITEALRFSRLRHAEAPPSKPQHSAD